MVLRGSIWVCLVWSWYPFFSGLKGTPKGTPHIILGGGVPKQDTHTHTRIDLDSF